MAPGCLRRKGPVTMARLPLLRIKRLRALFPAFLTAAAISLFAQRIMFSIIFSVASIKGFFCLFSRVKNCGERGRVI